MQKRLAFVPGVMEQLENEYSGRDSLWGAGYTIEGEGVKDPSDEQAPGVVHLPSQEFQIPTFTIPNLYPLRLPLLGVLDLSTSIYSNLYNWSASYTGGNTSTDHWSLQAQYHVKADSVVDLLSYHVQGEPCSWGGSQNSFAACPSGRTSSRKGKTSLQIFFLLLGTLFFFYYYYF